MSEPRRQAYLEAMGYDVWLARPAPAEPEHLFITPNAAGAESVLLVCERSDQRDSQISADIARALGNPAAWAWPGEQSDRDSKSGSHSSLSDLVRERLFTEVIVFGQELSLQLGCKRGAPVMGSARIHVVASLDELAVSSPARRSLWLQVLKDRVH